MLSKQACFDYDEKFIYPKAKLSEGILHTGLFIQLKAKATARKLSPSQKHFTPGQLLYPYKTHIQLRVEDFYQK